MVIDMLICFDVGNTHTVVGVYSDNENYLTYRISTDAKITSDELGIKLLDILKYNNYKTNKYEVIVSSVVPKFDNVIKSMCLKYFNCEPIIVGQKIKSGIKIRLDNPKELGADLLVGAVAATTLYGDNLVIVDMGTATTFVYVKNNELLGGSIIPSMRTAFSSLFEKAARLEEVSFEKPNAIVGRDTKTSIQSGMYYGYSSMIEGMLEKYHHELGDFRVILTGGESILLKDSFMNKDKYIFDNDLLIKGLKILYDKNK